VALLAALLLAVPSRSASAGAPPAIPPAAAFAEPPPPPAIPPAVALATAEDPAKPLTQDEKKKQIAEIEKKIADLQKQLDDLKKNPTGPTVAPGTVPASYVEKMNWRPVGPANMGGRVTAIAVHPVDSNTYYVATASGGLLKTVNNGTTFTHQFDHQSSVSIGDVAVAPSEPNTVWVGTGEANPRNSVSRGDGVYKSTDGGKNWTNMGLKESFQVGKIVVHPKDPNVVYVGALGRLYGPGGDRGVFKTEDGGKTWKNVLTVDDKTGAVDLRMDPFDPNTLLVGMWERKRDAHDGYFGRFGEFPAPDRYGPEVTYGPGGGLFKTADAGKTWKKLTDAKLNNGLPTVKTGRIGLDYSAKTKGLVYAIVDTENIGKGKPVVTVSTGMSVEDEDVVLKVTNVPKDSPAAKAGVKEGDVIVSIDGKKIADHDAYEEALAAMKADQTIKVVVLRDKKEVTVELKLAAKPKDPPPAVPPILGIQPDNTSTGDGIGVGSLTPAGPAMKAGLKVGDLITTIGGKKVTDQAEYRSIMASHKVGDVVKVTVIRGKEMKEFELTLVAGRTGPGSGGGRPGGGGPISLTRPNLKDNRDIGGQTENVQDNQGKDGFQTGGVYVSKDNGETWTRVNSLNPRPFYFSTIRVDPTDDKLIYVLGDLQIWKSADGGKRFVSGPVRGVHPDFHALWIDPKNNKHMLTGCDGGFYVTYDQGATWDHLNILALGQFYHVAVDNRRPYRVYGGLQDNGSWGGPSQVLRSQGPVNDDWVFLRGGDGFVCRVDPNDPDLVYSESQNGVIGRRNMRTGEAGAIRPRPVKEGEELRFNWNTPFILSSHNPSIFYCGAQYVFRSLKRGDDIKPISPDLTRTPLGTMTAIAESPRSADVLYAGTDDGYLWVTKDGGKEWTNLTEKLLKAGVPGPRWVSSIEPSRTIAGRCYVTLDAHRSDDDHPYVLVTEDYGDSWKSITANLPAAEWSRVVREDLVNPDLLYCGTEYGIWFSANRGASWTRLNNNLPTVAVHEVAQPTTASEIVVATHGRSIWILDVASLRQMTADTLKAPVTLFAPATAVRWKIESGREFAYSVDVRKFYGKNPEWGAGIDYLVAQPAKKLTLKVQDVSGATVWDYEEEKVEAGFHRQNWPLTRSGGGVIRAGEYRVVLTVDGKEFTQKVVVENDPHADPKAIINAPRGAESYLQREREEKEQGIRDEDEEEMEKGKKEDDEKRLRFLRRSVLPALLPQKGR
jgi:photosystem II stability/assembly factor-like uncharacterized protein